MVVIDHFLRPTGGTEGQVYNLIKRLNPQKFHIELCVYRYTSDYFNENPFPCPVTSLEINSFFNPLSLVKLVQFRRYLINEQFDIVQTFFNESALTIPFLMARSGVKVISARRDMGFWYTMRKIILLRLAQRFVEKYNVNSNAVKKNIIKFEKVPENKISVIYNIHELTKFNVSVNDCFLKQQKIPADAKIIGIVANFRPVKRVDDMIRAFSMISKLIDRSYLVCVGHQGKLLNAYKRLAKQLGILHRVRFTGNIDNTIPVMKLFEVGVICSESEGPFKYDYRIYGVWHTCQVATKTGGNIEIVEDKKTGLLVEVGDVKGIAKATLSLIENRVFRNRVIYNARQQIFQLCEGERQIYKHEKFYLETVLKTR